jgi:hypothetical protein
MRARLLLALGLAATACSGGSDTPPDSGNGFVYPDAPDSVPVLTSFVPTPAMVTPGVATEITWNWTYQIDPPFPFPTCTIDNGVGEVTRGQTTTVTINETTAFRLTCSNRAGMTARDTVISIPPVAPDLATFTATPTSLMPNAATTVTFDWTYTTPPSPTPNCAIDGNIGVATPGMTASVTLPQARTYRLRCQNQLGTSTREVTVSVNECAGGTAECGANATCTDTANGYTCTCNSGYSGNGDVCSATNQACTTPGVCSADATCVGGTTCVCNAGYVGDGLTCTREHLAFVTSTSGTGNLSSTGWGTAAGALTGLAAADNICQTAATNAGFTGTFKAWMSDATDDAYCRIHGLSGKKTANCGLGALPVAAGPWVRTDAQRTPAAPAIERLIAPVRQTFYPVTYTELGSDVGASSPQIIWTGTNDGGAYSGTACGDWAGSGTGTTGMIGGGGTSWTNSGSASTCSSSGRLLCMEVGTGPALPPRHPTSAKKAFVTSVAGGPVFGLWSDANGATGITAADEVCRARARYAGYPNAASFKAWMSGYYESATTRITYNGPWYRPDGIMVASSETDLTDGRVSAPLYMTETNQYVAGDVNTGSVWTGSYYYGSYYPGTSSNCYMWTYATSYTAVVGRHDLSDYRWFSFGATSSSPTFMSCTATDYRIYCLEDAP